MGFTMCARNRDGEGEDACIYRHARSHSSLFVQALDKGTEIREFIQVSCRVVDADELEDSAYWAKIRYDTRRQMG